MINKIVVDGFRSLRKFELDLVPGLNVLVGPNGAGKTNIILFFEFVRLICVHGVNNAVGQMGGAGNIFQKRGKQRFSETIDFSIYGKVDSEQSTYSYEVSAVIKASVSAQEIYIQSQSIKIIDQDGLSYLDVDFKSNKSVGGDPEVEWRMFPEKNSASRIYLGKDDTEKYASKELMLDHVLVNFLSIAVPLAEEVGNDLSSRFLLNVIPSAVKDLEDSTRHPGIDSNGSGLSATLYAIKKKRPIPDGMGRLIFKRTETKSPSWSRVLSQIKIAVPTIEDIDVENESFDNRLRVKITIGKGSRRAVLPLSALSDGTVKWMSLVVRLATSRAALLLEEPENYLHPLMQQEVVRLLRDSVSDGGFVLLSTHSETLLNAVRPNEVIVTHYRAGSTRACRVKNAVELAEEISLTGFGLGYYYLADAIRS